MKGNYEHGPNADDVLEAVMTYLPGLFLTSLQPSELVPKR